MKAIIPAAGIGTRLRPHTHSLPKALLYVAGKPIISHILDDVVALGIRNIVLIVGYKGDLIEAYVRRAYPDIEVQFVVQEERKGMGHAVHLCRDAVAEDGPLWIILGDTIIKTDLSALVESKTNVLGVKAVDDPRRFGVCELDGDRISRLVEKPENPPSDLALVGLYFFLETAPLFRALFDEIRQNKMNHGEYQITDALQMMIDRGEEFSPFLIDEWFDCGKPETMLDTNRRLLEDSQDPAPRVRGSIILPPVSISPEATIEGSIVGPYVSIAENVTVRNAILRDSIIAEEATVENSLLENSLVGARAVVRGGFQKLDVGDSSEIVIR